MKNIFFIITIAISLQTFGQSFSEYARKGAKYLDNGEYEKAIIEYDKAIKLNSEYNSAYANRGIAKAKLNDHIAAIKDFDKAIELKNSIKNTDETWLYWKGNTFYSRGLSKIKAGIIEEAILDFQEAKKLKYEPNDCDRKIIECTELLEKK